MEKSGKSENSVSIAAGMVEVHGCGVLLRGASGSGKSDLALGLLDRGHFFVADDLVTVSRESDHLYGRAVEGARGFAEIHGLGVVNLGHLYGDLALLDRAKIGLVITLSCQVDYDRLQPCLNQWDCLGITVPELLLPGGLGRNMPLLIETAVRLREQWFEGYDAAADFERNMKLLMKQGAA